MDVAVVFAGVNTADPSVVAQAVANYMAEHSDQLLPEEAAAIYEQMYAYGVPRAFVPTPTGNGYPSITG